MACNLELSTIFAYKNYDTGPVCEKYSGSIYILIPVIIGKGPVMVFDEISSIVSEIEKAKEIQRSLLLFSKEPLTIDRASKLSDVISKLEANVVSIQSEYIQILKVKKDLEELIKSDPCIKIVE